MKAFVIKDDKGQVIRAWFIRTGQPHLSTKERDLFERSGRTLEEVTPDEALSCASFRTQYRPLVRLPTSVRSSGGQMAKDHWPELGTGQ